MRPVRVFLILGFLGLLVGPVPGPAAAGAPHYLEELRYRVGLTPFQEVARVHLRLTEVGPGRYRAEFAGAAQGAWKLLSRWLPERYETEMAFSQGRLQPLVYREEFEAGGHHISKEYQFNYARKLLTVWRSQDHREPLKQWQGPMQKGVSDPLSLFYNLRLGAYGPLRPGQTLRIPLVPTPEPHEMVLRLGDETPQGLKVMVEVKGTGSDAELGPYYLVCSRERVIRRAWTRVLCVARLSGQLLSPAAGAGQGLQILPKLSLYLEKTEKP